MASAHKTATTRALLDHVEHGRTGRLAVGAGAAEIALYLLDGAVVGARASDDTASLIQRMGQTGHVPTARVRQLQAMVSMSLPILGRQTHDPILGLLSDEVGPELFEQVMEERFEENLRRFVSNAGTPRYTDGVAPWCENIRVTHDTVSLVSQCVQEADLGARLDDELVLQVGPVPASSALALAATALLGDGSRTVRELTGALPGEPLALRAAVARMVEAGVLVEPSRRPVDDDPFGAAPVHAVDVAGLVPDDELDAFSGAEDRVRGGSRGGTFVAARRNLDRVDIGNLEGIVHAPVEEADLFEDDDAREVAFSAPALTEADALGKISVANEVLGVLSRAIDAARGPQRGQATVQLLVDGRPRSYVSLFEGIRVTSAGGLPSRELLDNLQRRPATEQRRLLNQGMLDLLDRALDKAADELPDDVFDGILERVMGYRQRLGL